MPRSRPRAGGRKARHVTFRADPELAAFLDALPNRADYVRLAVLAQAGCLCPLCGGRGYVRCPPPSEPPDGAGSRGGTGQTE